MNHKSAEALLDKYLEGKCSPEESVIVESWYNETSEQLNDLPGEPDYKRAHELLSKRLSIARKPVRLWPRIAAAAAILLIVGTGAYFFADRYSLLNRPAVAYAHDINPGGYKATLTFANGAAVKLSDLRSGVVIDAKKLKYDDGTNVLPNDSVIGELSALTVRTPRGGTYQVVLPDGTKVWLNAASSIKFPASFKGLKERVVELHGEGYFEVTKVHEQPDGKEAQQRHVPFVVRGKGLQVEVLGTHFNISNYDDDQSARTTLLEGSVRINKNTLLSPGMQAVLNNGKIELKKMTDPDAAISWQGGYFTFERESLDEIMRKVARWYDVSVVYKNDDIRTIPFSGSITRFAKVSEVLKMLELTNKVKFSISGENIIIDHK